MKNKVKDIDRGYKDLLQELLSLDGVSVEVGVFGEAGDDVVTYAAAQEFGTEHIPARSYLRSTLTINAKSYQEMLAKGLKRKGSMILTLRSLAKRMEQDVKSTIYAGVDPPLKDETVKRKGSAQPLIDTGTLVSSIKAKVVFKGDG